MTETDNSQDYDAEIIMRDMDGNEIGRVKATREEALEFIRRMEEKGATMLTTEEAAKKANVKPTTIRKAIERGQLKADFFGTQRKIKEADLRTWMATKRGRGRPRKENG